jgi:hypothetical protein
MYQRFPFQGPPKFIHIGIFGLKINHLATLVVRPRVTRSNRRHTGRISSNFERHSATQRDTALHSATQRDTARHSATLRDTARHSATQRDTARHSATQRNTARHENDCSSVNKPQLTQKRTLSGTVWFLLTRELRFLRELFATVGNLWEPLDR